MAETDLDTDAIHTSAAVWAANMAKIDRLFWPAVAAVVLLGVLTMFAGVLVWGVLR